MKCLKFFIFLCILTFTVSCGQQKRYIQYKVKKGETMSEIAQKLAMKTANLKRLNPDVNGEPKANTFLVVPQKNLNNLKNIEKEIPEVEKDSLFEDLILTEEEKNLLAIKEKYEVYEVKKGDTFFNLKQRFGRTREELLMLNPELAEGLKLGMLLKIKEIPVEFIFSEGNFYDDYIDTDKDLKVALLLPFRTHKYQSDSILLKEIFASNATLVNIATDFYLGAEMAIDSLRSKGVDIELSIYDTGDRRANGVQSIISSGNLNNNDVIIGPLYLEEAKMIASNVSIPVVYPVYSADQSSFLSSNIVKTSPEKNVFREELERYIIENFHKNDSLVYADSIVSQDDITRGGNIIIVSDQKSIQASKLMQSNLSFNTNAVLNILQPVDGYIEKSRFLELLKPNENNWVVIATADNVIVNDAINSLISLPEETSAKVFTFDKGRVYDKIDNRKLAKIGFTYISDDFVDASAENTKIFNKQYQKKNNALPSFYAAKGFDITYDILVRLASGKELRTTLDEGVSVRVESKFDYRNSNTVPENKGLFIVRYNKDLTLTRLK